MMLFFVVSVLGLCGSLAAAQEDTVAMIIGGLDETQSILGIHRSVEVFGCPGQESSISIADYPGDVYLSAAAHIPDPNTGGLGNVISCGGNYIEPGEDRAGYTDKCFVLDPNTMTWGPTGSLTETKWAHQLVMVANTESGSDDLVPMALGGQGDATNIYNPNDGTWNAYKGHSARNWLSVGCVTQYNGKIYHIRNDIFEMDPATLDTIQLGEVPSRLRRPGRCTGYTVDGVPGILMRDGYWYNIKDDTWTQIRFPPYPPFLTNERYLPDAIYSFRGRPTIFGNIQSCDAFEPSTCLYKDVVTFDGESATWKKIGEMRESRTTHDVIEVPAAICDKITVPASPEKETAALIIGGFSEMDQTSRIKSTVEIFGCRGYDSVVVDPYPVPIMQTGATYHTYGGNKVLSCGGLTPLSGTTHGAVITTDCYEFTPEGGWTALPGSLTSTGRFTFLMAMSGNLATGNPDPVPLAVGNRPMAEIFDPESGTWKEYLELPTNRWRSIGCLFQHENRVYHMDDKIYELNLDTWNVHTLGNVPDFLVLNMGRCSYAEVAGRPGILLRRSYWYDIGSNSWSQIQFPSFSPFVFVDPSETIDTNPPLPNTLTDLEQQPNTLFSFRGKPTYFGSTENCDEDRRCDYTEILQYDGAQDAWYSIGQLSESKSLMEVIEVPISFCEKLAPTTTPATTPTTTVPGQSTGATNPTNPPTTTQAGGSQSIGVSALLVSLLTVAALRF